MVARCPGRQVDVRGNQVDPHWGSRYGAAASSRLGPPFGSPRPDHRVSCSIEEEGPRYRLDAVAFPSAQWFLPGRGELGRPVDLPEHQRMRGAEMSRFQGHAEPSRAESAADDLEEGVGGAGRGGRQVHRRWWLFGHTARPLPEAPR